MGYIYSKTNKIRIICYNLITNEVYKDLVFSSFVIQKIKDETKEYENLNHEIVFDNIGQRMQIKATILNRSNDSGNSQQDIINLIECINLVKSGYYRFKIYPNYVVENTDFRHDIFNCIVSGRYEIEDLHSFIDSGHNIVVEFIEATPNKSFVPKPRYTGVHPLISQQNQINLD